MGVLFHGEHPFGESTEQAGARIDFRSGLLQGLAAFRAQQLRQTFSLFGNQFAEACHDGVAEMAGLALPLSLRVACR
jgi:hypothetical protein